MVELGFAQPNWVDVASGLIPRLSSDSLYTAMGILGVLLFVSFSLFSSSSSPCASGDGMLHVGDGDAA